MSKRLGLIFIATLNLMWLYGQPEDITLKTLINGNEVSVDKLGRMDSTAEIILLNNLNARLISVNVAILPIDLVLAVSLRRSQLSARILKHN